MADQKYTRTVLILALLQISTFTNSAVMHSHQHQHSSNKEREEDGAYSPRNRGYHTNSKMHDTEFDHESVLGSVKEAEEYDRLPPDEAKIRLNILLVKMDLNGDEQIDKQELKAWILRSFKMLSREEAAENLQDTDENGDGKVTWDEYFENMYGSDDSDEALEVNKENLREDKYMWKVADFNGDGVLEGEEWVAFSHPEEHPDMFPHILEHTLQEKDLDKDGSISFQEYIGDRGKDQDKAWLAAEKDQFDTDLDKDGDGKLNRNEILSWVMPSNDEIAEEEMLHLFSESDDNSDGVLSFDEILDHHETFVGSEATDYGDHLHNIHQFQDEL